MYRQVPGGLQQVVAPAVGPVDELVADLLARSQEALCVGDGAQRYRDRDPRRLPLRVRRRRRTRRPAPLVQLAHARALREEWVSPGEIRPAVPAPARRPDQLVDRGQRPMSERSRWHDEHAGADCCSSGADDGRVGRSSRCAAATSAEILAIEQASYPKPWTRTVFHDELDQVARRRPPLRRRPPRPRRRRLRRADVRRRRGPRHEHRRAPRPPARAASPPGCSSSSPARPSSAAAWRWTLEVRASSTGAQALYRRSGSRRPASGQATTRTPRTPS